MPARTRSHVLASRISRTALSTRPSSSSCVNGTPATRITLPPFLSTSVARNVTPARSAAAGTLVTSSCRVRRALRVGDQLARGGGHCFLAVLGHDLVDALELDEPHRRQAVLRLD